MRKYLDFLNESSAEELDRQKRSLVTELESLRRRLVIDFQDTPDASEPQNIDVETELNRVSDTIGQEAAESFNVESFLRKVSQIIDLSGPDTKTLGEAFENYYQSLERRIETLAGEDKKSSYDEFYDKWEGEKSVLSRKQFEREKFDLQVELLKLQEWVKKNKKRIAIVFEGRDTAGKGSTIKRFIEYLDPKGFRVVALGVPTEWERRNWFKRYERHMPKPGEIVFFDRSWHNRSVVEPAMGYCTEEQYKGFMSKVNEWESGLVDSGVILIKFWFSITREKQAQRFDLRMKSPLKYWKFSPNDAKVINKWDLISYYKKQMFSHNSTKKCPWTIVNTNDKKVGILNSIRYVLDTIDYEGKNPEHTRYYPEVVNVIGK